MLRQLVVAALAAGVIAVPARTPAAPNEIKIFTDELANYREQNLEIHANKGRTPLQIMPEYSYGIWQNWEISFQLPASIGSEARQLQGYRAELQYVAPHEEDEDGFYWGFNLELGRIKRAEEAAFWSLELIPILGYRQDRWHFVANPGVDRAVSGSSRTTNFQPAAKIAYRAFRKNYFGLEYYVDAGPLRNPLPSGEQSRVLYVAWDGRIGKSEINVGIGRGFTDASDRWVIKMIYEFVLR